MPFRAAGIPTTATTPKQAEIEPLKKLAPKTPGPMVAVTKVLDEYLKFVLPSNSGSYLNDRFRTVILGEGAA